MSERKVLNKVRIVLFLTLDSSEALPSADPR